LYKDEEQMVAHEEQLIYNRLTDKHLENRKIKQRKMRRKEVLPKTGKKLKAKPGTITKNQNNVEKKSTTK
jgi:hypothetical protein